MPENEYNKNVGDIKKDKIQAGESASKQEEPKQKLQDRNWLTDKT